MLIPFNPKFVFSLGLSTPLSRYTEVVNNYIAANQSDPRGKFGLTVLITRKDCQTVLTIASQLGLSIPGAMACLLASRARLFAGALQRVNWYSGHWTSRLEFDRVNSHYSCETGNRRGGFRQTLAGAQARFNL